MDMTTNWKQIFDKAWETSYGRIIYGELGFLTTDAGEPFSIDKDLVKDFISTLLDERDREIMRMISEEELGTVSSGQSYGDVKQGFDYAKELITNKVKSN